MLFLYGVYFISIRLMLTTYGGTRRSTIYLGVLFLQLRMEIFFRRDLGDMLLTKGTAIVRTDSYELDLILISAMAKCMNRKETFK